jgi:cation transport regulator ChaB
MCVDIQREKLTYREVSANSQELIMLNDHKQDHYKDIFNAAKQHFIDKSDGNLDKVVPKEVFNLILKMRVR